MSRTILVIFYLFLSSFITSINDEYSIDTSVKHDEKESKNVGEKIFIENKGQWNEEVLFRAKLSTGNVYIRKKGISFVQIDNSHFEKGGHYRGDGTIKGERVDFDFINNNDSRLGIAPFLKSKFTHNYIDKNGDSITSYAYSGVYISNMYDGIDWRIYTTIYGGLKHEFILKPNADPSIIKIKPKGHRGLKLSEGQLHIDTNYLPIIEKKPETYYSKSHKKIPVSYQIEKGIVSFKFLKKYDKNLSIVIDPELIFSTYSGSFGDNWGFTATYGENGTAYTAGIVFDYGFPVTEGVFQANFSNEIDIGVLKFSSDGSSLLYATYLGGNDFDIPHSLLLDRSDNLLIFGTTSSADFPTTSGVYQSAIKRESNDISFRELSFEFSRSTDLFLARLSKDGRTLLQSTLIGGTGIDGINTVLTKEDALSQIKQKQLSYNYGDSFRGDLAQDNIGNVYVSSTTKSRDFPITSGAYQSTYGGGSSDAIIFKINESFSQLIWSTFVGGNYGENFYNMKINSNNDILACGSTTSTSSFLPTSGKYKPSFSRGPLVSNGEHNPDGFIAKISKETGNLTGATYVGTSGYDQLYFVDTDTKGDIFTIGITRSSSFAKSSNTYGNNNGGVFIQKLSEDLSTGLLSTRIGSIIPSISPTAFLVNKCDDIYITGFGNGRLGASYRHPSTPPSNFLSLNPSTVDVTFEGSTFGLPVSSDAFQKNTDGSDFYLIILNKDAKEFVYGTFFGGTGRYTDIFGIETDISTEHLDGGTNRFDKDGIIYHAVCAGCGGINSLPTTSTAYSTRNNSPSCNNGVFKFNFLRLNTDFNIRASNGESADASIGCTPYTIDISNTTTGTSSEYEWNMGDGTVIKKTNKDTFSYTFQNSGIYDIKLTSKTDNSCLGYSEKNIRVTVMDSGVNITNNASICPSDTYQLWITNAQNVTWRVKNGAIIGQSDRVNVTPQATTTYVVTGTSKVASCSIYKEVIISVISDVVAGMTYSQLNSNDLNPSLICSELPTTLVFKNTSQHGESYIWNFGDGQTTTTFNRDDVTHEYQNEGVFNITITANSKIACNHTHSVTKTVTIGSAMRTEEPTVSICKGDKKTFTVVENIKNIKWYKNRVNNENLFAEGKTVEVSPEVNTIYFATGTTILGCSYIKKATINILDVSFLQFRINLNKTCFFPLLVQLDAYIDSPDGIKPVNLSKIDINIDMGDKNTYKEVKVNHTYAKDGNYIITMVGKEAECEVSRTLNVEVPHLRIPNVITPNGDRLNDTLFIQGQHKIQLVVFDRWDSNVFKSDDYKNDWPPQNTKHRGVYFYEATIHNGDTCNGWLEIK